MKFKLLILFVMLGALANAQPSKTRNIILITLDGMRWQEVFGGADPRLVGHTPIVEDTVALKQTFWAPSSAERRARLFPFLWSVVEKNGQLYGNRAIGSLVNTTNKMWFSYPGYNEILTGAADDTQVTTNDHVDNPNVNILEYIEQQPGFNGKVAAFSSWDCFPWIINVGRNGLPVNSGKVSFTPLNDKVAVLNEIQFQLPDISGSTRLDAFTFHYAFEYLKRQQPRVLFISFDETDHYAHEGRYEHYLASARYTDDMIGQLWSWIQQQPAYKDQTTMIITCDHGRGGDNQEDWKHHGSKVRNADQIWMGIIGPDTPATGEQNKGQFYQNQIAQTIAQLLGLQFKGTQPAGQRISNAFRK
ncbi:MAG: LTA synthase family protein [Cyclobacteriaceae bacterium]|nr:LTA synthase family protein [Cyclobacteriaceae bacterium]